MENAQKIKQLRSLIPCPLDRALALLKQSKGDIEQAITIFHQQNVEEIMAKFDCDKATAENFYAMFGLNFNKIQAKVDEIAHLQRMITMRADKIRHNEVGFTLYPEDENCNRYPIKGNYTFIPVDDFALIIDFFRAEFPIYDFWCQETQERFEVCWHNTFDNAICQRISKNIRKQSTEHPKEKAFFIAVADWLDERLSYAHHIVVEGNQ